MIFDFVSFFLKNLSLIVFVMFLLAGICMIPKSKKINSISFLLMVVMFACSYVVSVFELTIITEAQKTILANIRSGYGKYDAVPFYILAFIYMVIFIHFIIKTSKEEGLEED